MKVFRRLVLLCALVTAGVSTAACPPKPPAGTYSPTGTRAAAADQGLKDLTAVSQTAINLNATTGRLHLSDRDTRLVRDAVLAIGTALDQYAKGTSTAVQVRAGLDTLLPQLSVEARANATLAKVLAVLASTLQSLPQ